MAEHLIRKMAADAGLTDVSVESAGIAPALSLSLPVEAIRALAEEGVSVDEHKPKAVDARKVKKADVIIPLAAIVGATACDRDPWRAETSTVSRRLLSAPSKIITMSPDFLISERDRV